MTTPLICWHCGQALLEVIFPMSRREECPACGADQHVCKMCSHYSPGRSDDCSEDRAEAVTNKEQANFCDFFAATHVTPANVNVGSNQQARDELEALFDNQQTEILDSPATGSELPLSEAEKALAALNDLFKKD